MDGRSLTKERRRSAEWWALAAAVMPAIVMVSRAAISGWAPLFDAAYFTVRSRDVFTTRNPLVGAWSNGSREVGVWVNNLGPLQLDLLAPFTKIDPYWGTALGVGLTNVAAIVGVWCVSRRLFATSTAVVGAMAATMILQLDMGSLMLIEARQQLALLLPLWCLLWLAAAVWAGHRWAVPWLVFVASVVVQTHFTYAYQTIAVTVAGLIAIAFVHRGRIGELARTTIVSLSILLVVWALPLWDQFRGTGNMAAVLGQSGGSSRSVGLSTGLSILAESGFVPPFFVPGSMGDLLRQGDRPSLPMSVIAVLAWTALLLLIAVALRATSSALSPMAAVGLVALGSSAYAAIKIPPTEQFGIVAQNYYWMWPIGIFAATTIAGAALRTWWRTPRLADVMAGLVAVAALTLVVPTNRLPETSREWSVSRHVARPLMDELRDNLADRHFDAPVLVDLGAVRHVRYTMLAELQRRGIDFRFAAGTTDLSRFGRDRCDDGTAAWLMSLRDGDDALRIASGTDGDVLLASVPGLNVGQFDRLSELAEEFGNALRSGTVVVDDDAITGLGGTLLPRLDQVRRQPGTSARRLSWFLSDWARYGAVQVPDDLVEDLAEWRSLEDAAANDRMAIYLRPIPPTRANRCDTLEPGTIS